MHKTVRIDEFRRALDKYRINLGDGRIGIIVNDYLVVLNENVVKDVEKFIEELPRVDKSKLSVGIYPNDNTDVLVRVGEDGKIYTLFFDALVIKLDSLGVKKGRGKKYQLERKRRKVMDITSKMWNLYRDSVPLEVGNKKPFLSNEVLKKKAIQAN